jgi:hypothetical protein
MVKQLTYIVSISVGLFFALMISSPNRIGVAQKRNVNNASSLVPESLLRRADTAWPRFLARFRSALKTRNRHALYSMASRQFEENCVEANGRDIRKQFFADNSALNSYLDIVTPGRRKSDRSTIGATQWDKSAGDVSRTAVMACWSLTFKYRQETGWLLTYYGQSCEGC